MNVTQDDTAATRTTEGDPPLVGRGYGRGGRPLVLGDVPGRAASLTSLPVTRQVTFDVVVTDADTGKMYRVPRSASTRRPGIRPAGTDLEGDHGFEGTCPTGS